MRAHRAVADTAPFVAASVSWPDAPGRAPATEPRADPAIAAPLPAKRAPFAKRVLDLGVALPALVLLSPLMLLIALAIRLQDGGPALFRQTRGGFQGRPFRILKFRSMTTQDNGAVILQATRNDPRITRLGALLRKTSLDELPQLINVVRGDMSLVGPRPHALAHDQYYGARIDAYRLRFAVRPGVTGLAQVSGCRGETATLAEMERRIALDVDYAARSSVLLDLSILLRTLGVIFGPGRGY